ncbi:MAG: tRNA (adenine(22)-N(1))-methyltransferase TrmK [Candidatus Bathyarchaeota archaeon]|nr:tRNA (adenine(22)-N(1))-methyltransferase TrmK [Candidatus Bathyarchaeota archaeon]
MVGVYRPAEDSTLLLKHAQAMVSGSVLDMGTGSGILAIAAAQKSEVTRVVAVDIDPDAIKHARSQAEESGVSGRIEFRVGDLFDGMGGEGFDWILFNPPYLPSDGPADEASWSGGTGGSETIRRFLETADGHLNPEGAIIIVHSSRTGLAIEEVEEKYSVKVLEGLPLFFERLYCLLLRPLSPSGGPGRTRR